MEPSSTWPTNYFTRSRPRSSDCASRLNRPEETIWSSRDVDSVVVSSAVVVAAASGLVELIISTLLLRVEFALQLLASFRARYSVEKHGIELVVALERTTQI